MPWVRFTKDMTWKPRSMVSIVFRAGMVKNVTTACAEEAYRRERAVPATNPKRKQTHGDQG
jgi:hypothetical protein